jgi:hypothetical protein
MTLTSGRFRVPLKGGHSVAWGSLRPKSLCSMQLFDDIVNSGSVFHSSQHPSSKDDDHLQVTDNEALRLFVGRIDEPIKASILS